MNATKTLLVIDDEVVTRHRFRLFINAYIHSVLSAEKEDTGDEKKQTCGFESDQYKT